MRIARQAIRRAEDSGSSAAQAAAYWNASIYESERGGLVPAIALAERALELLGQGDDRRNIARLQGEVGLMMLRLDPPEPADAERHLKRARRDLAASSGGPIDLARCDVGLAEARILMGDSARAKDLATSALKLVEGRSPDVAAATYAVLGKAAAAEGDNRLASAHYRSAIAELTSAGQDRGAAQLWLDLGTELELLGDAEAAADAYRRAAVASGLRISSALRKSAMKD